MRGHEIKIETMVECGNSQKCQNALSGGSDLLATAGAVRPKDASAAPLDIQQF
jgi:hypothetical protein